MKLNVADPSSGGQKQIEIDDEKRLHLFFEKRMGQDIDVSDLGDEWKGYILRCTGGCDKQGFPMMQGVLANSRVSLLLKRGQVGFQQWRGRPGERRRKSVRGCIIGADISMLNLIIVKKGQNDLPGITDKDLPRRLGPKRASKIRKLFNLTKYDDVRKFVIRREVTNKAGKTKSKAPKIQRLVTPTKLATWQRAIRNKRLRAQATRALHENYRKEVSSARKAAQAKTKQRRIQLKISKGLLKPSKIPQHKKEEVVPKRKAAAPKKNARDVARKDFSAPRKEKKDAKAPAKKQETKTAPAKTHKKK